MCGWACSAALQPPVLCSRQARSGRTTQKAAEREEEAALRRRLLRQPLVLTTHAHERLQGRQVAAEEVEAVLRQGTLNRRMSKFGGKPSPVFVFEAELQAPLAVQPAAAVGAGPAGGEGAPTDAAMVSASAGAAVAVRRAAAAEQEDAAALQQPPPVTAAAAAAEQEDAAALQQPPPVTAAAAAAAQGVAAAAASPRGRRHLRVILAAREDATVVLTAVNLSGPSPEASD